MNLYSQTQVSALEAEFPDCDVRTTLQRIQDRSADEPIRHPMALARSWLKRDSLETPISNPEPRPRGTFRPDGSWWADAKHPSATEAALRQFTEAVARLKLSPAQAADLLPAMPLVAACYRGTLQLEIVPTPPAPRPAIHPDLASVEAAWASTSTSTSAEEAVKRGVLKHWKKPLQASYYPAEQALEDALGSAYAEADDPDNGSAW